MTDLRSSQLRSRRSKHEDFNPGEGALNLADVMLVFACGLLASIISFWDITLPAPTEVRPEVDMQELQSDPGEAQAAMQGDGYTELGTVYEDPATGKLYMVIEGPTGDGQ